MTPYLIGSDKRINNTNGGCMFRKLLGIALIFASCISMLGCNNSSFPCIRTPQVTVGCDDQTPAQKPQNPNPNTPATPQSSGSTQPNAPPAPDGTPSSIQPMDNGSSVERRSDCSITRDKYWVPIRYQGCSSDVGVPSPTMPRNGRW